MKRRSIICIILCMQICLLNGCVKSSDQNYETGRVIEGLMSSIPSVTEKVKEFRSTLEEPVEEELEVETESTEQSIVMDEPEIVIEDVQPEVKEETQNYVIPISNRDASEFNAAYGETVATIRIPSVGMYAPVTYGDTQSNIDAYEITIRPNAHFDSSSAVILGGHNYKSFSKLFNVHIGDLIYIHSYYGDFTFQVDTITHGTTDETGSNVFDDNGNEILNLYSYTNRLYMYTCDYTGPQGRLVVSAVMK